MTRFGWRVIAIAGGLAVLVGLTLTSVGMDVLWAGLVGVNAVTMLAYGYDKRAARAGGWRLPEAALHVMAAAGGTPGGLLGQSMFRHKTRDRRFLFVFWTIVVLQAAALAVYFRTRSG